MALTHTYLHRPRMAMLIFGLWFPPKKFKILYNIYTKCLITIICCFTFSNFLYMGVVWGDLEQVSEASYLLFTEATVCLKITIFILNHKSLMRLLQCMDDEAFASQSRVHDKILSTFAKRMWRIYLFFVTSGFCNCSEWAIVPLVEKESKIFPFKIWMPVDPGSANMTEYVISYVYQVVAIVLSAGSYLTLDFFTTTLIMFVAAQLEIVTDKIKQVQNVVLCNSDKEHRKRLTKENNMLLVECIRRHQALLRFMHTVEKTFNANIFAQLTSTVFIICIICLRMTIEPPNTFHFYSTVNYLVTMLTQVYLYCWCGSEITERGQLLRDALYNSVWYEQDSKYKRNLWIALQFMKRPLIFRAGSYIPLSRPTFVSILRCSYSYFAVLNQANKK